MKILIEDLKIKAIIGILPFEREKPQTIILNAKIEYDYQGVYLNYVELVEFLTSKLEQNQYGLLEEALQDLHTQLKTNFPLISHLSLSIKKPDILTQCIVGVEI